MCEPYKIVDKNPSDVRGSSMVTSLISCIHNILKHTRSVGIFYGVSGRDLLSKDLQLYTKC